MNAIKQLTNAQTAINRLRKVDNYTANQLQDQLDNRSGSFDERVDTVGRVERETLPWMS